MNAENARAQVFGDSLVCEETRAAAFVPMEFDPAAVRAACQRAEALLHSIAIIEDGKVEESDERGAHEHALQRVEAKLDLLTSLVATLVSSHRPPPAPRRLQWSAMGACLTAEADAASSVPGSNGMFRVQACDWLPEPLELPATVLASVADANGHHLWLRFQPLPPPLVSAVERHLFRIHRRAVAEARRPR